MEGGLGGQARGAGEPGRGQLSGQSGSHVVWLLDDTGKILVSRKYKTYADRARHRWSVGRCVSTWR